MPLLVAVGAAAAAAFVVSSAQQARVREAFAALSDWDLGVVGRYCVAEGIYSAEDIDEVMDEYKKFMAMAMAFGAEPVPVSEFLDDFWHTHIVFTQDYAAMCQTIAGRFVHHRPRILDDEAMLAAAFTTRTMDLYRQCFGEPNRKVWNSALCRCGPED